MAKTKTTTKKQFVIEVASEGGQAYLTTKNEELGTTLKWDFSRTEKYHWLLMPKDLEGTLQSIASVVGKFLFIDADGEMRIVASVEAPKGLSIVTETTEASEVNLFSGMKVNKIAPKKAMKKGAKPQVEFGPELDVLAALKTLSDVIETYQAEFDGEVRQQVDSEFLDYAIEHKTKPITFEAISDKAKATCSPVKRSTRSALKPEEVALLQEYGVPFERNEISAEIPELIGFNPELEMTPAIQAKISKALASIDELKGQQVFVKQEAQEAQYTYVVSELSAEYVCNNIADKEVLAKLLSIVQNKSLKVQLQADSSVSLLDQVFAILKANNINLMPKK